MLLMRGKLILHCVAPLQQNFVNRHFYDLASSGNWEHPTEEGPHHDDQKEDTHQPIPSE